MVRNTSDGSGCTMAIVSMRKDDNGFETSKSNLGIARSSSILCISLHQNRDAIVITVPEMVIAGSFCWFDALGQQNLESPVSPTVFFFFVCVVCSELPTAANSGGPGLSVHSSHETNQHYRLRTFLTVRHFEFGSDWLVVGFEVGAWQSEQVTVSKKSRKDQLGPFS